MVNEYGLSEEFMWEYLLPYQPCSHPDRCDDCGMAHGGDCGYVWEHHGLNTRLMLYDGEGGEYKMYLHHIYHPKGVLKWCDLTIAKEGSSVGGWASIMMQQICSASELGTDKLRDHLLHLRGQRFQPWGRTSHHVIKECTSIPDLVAGILLEEMDG